MTPYQASKIIGCSPQQVRTLIRTGKLKAKRKQIKNRYGEPTSGFEYEITVAEANRMRETKTDHGGWPRGKPKKAG